MSYADAVARLYALGTELGPPLPGVPRRKFELDHMRRLAEALGNPQKRFPSVLIAGTNGKGSTAAMLASILTCAGYRTGLYTSPHLQRVNERVQMSLPGQALSNTLAPIPDDDFARFYYQVDQASERLVIEGSLPYPPSFFEAMTAIAFLAFAESAVDIAVLEVGLGGRLDATNIVEPVLSVITDIALDHTEWLGPTLTNITREKTGILRPNGTMVTLPQHPEVNSALGDVAVALDVSGINAASYLPEQLRDNGPASSYTIVIDGQPVPIQLALRGSHQQRNAALAIASFLYLAVSKGFVYINAEVIRKGIALTRWPGRLELSTLPSGSVVLLDVAHNPAGAWSLRSYISQSMEAQQLPAPRTLIFSAYRDKAITEMAQILFPMFENEGDQIFLVPMSGPRAASKESLMAIAKSLEVNATPFASVGEALLSTEQDRPGTVVITGSVHLIGEAKSVLAQTAMRSA